MNYFQRINGWLNLYTATAETSIGEPSKNEAHHQDIVEEESKPPVPLHRRIGGVVLVVIGYLLSPLCWWNDIVFNLPLAVGFGYLASRVYPDGFVALTIVGYWLSNVVGFMMMQQGAIAALQNETQPQNPRKAFISGMVTSTAYTLVIVGLLQLHILDTPDIFSGDFWNQLDAMLPNWLSFGTY